MNNPLNPLAKPDPLTPCLALRTREAAAALGVSERTLWDWTQRGDVPHVRRGKTILYPVSALIRWLDEQATAKTAADADGGR
ncbi:MAG TPA: helix-turn-helix domain-containing protein [Phycisphaerae bacterium]|nr:helix-turn-helix domain-containing protein [Phycisphaerae bacterium]